MDPRGAARSRGARLRPALRPGADARRGVQRRREDDRDPGAGAAASPATLRARKAGRCARPAATCDGAGKVRAQQGFFVVERTCPGCMGSRRDRSPIPAAPATARAGRSSAASSTSTSPPGSTRAPASASPARAKPASAARPRRSLPVRPHEAPRDLRARGHDADRRVRRSASPPRRWAGRSSFPGIDGDTIEIKIPAGIQSGEQLRHRGAGMSVLNGRGRGDLVARDPGRDPDQAQQGAEGDPRAVPRHRDRRRMPGEQRLLRAAQGRMFGQ